MEAAATSGAVGSGAAAALARARWGAAPLEAVADELVRLAVGLVAAWARAAGAGAADRSRPPAPAAAAAAFSVAVLAEAAAASDRGVRWAEP